MNKIIIENLSLSYSDGTESLRDISLNIPAKAITVLFGPAGGGKSTLLRVINRLNDLADVEQISGTVLMADEDQETDIAIPVRPNPTIGWCDHQILVEHDGV